MPIDTTIDPDHLAVRVDNESNTDAQIFALDGVAKSYRMGFVRAHSSERFLLPAELLVARSGLQLVARPQGKNEYMLPSVQVGAQQTVVATLTDNPSFASAAVLIPPKTP
jgi:hypothetical protein